jgi:4-amino-4-deoxy-L-arabinose transferase-like glycosyltransferase
MLAVLPMLVARPELPAPELSQARHPIPRVEWLLASRFMELNAGHYQQLLFLTRLAGVCWSTLGGWLVYSWAGELYGCRGGLLALAIWCFEPTILGHAALATTDVPTAVAGLFAVYLFRRWLRYQTWLAAQLTGVGLGVALLTKFTLLIFVPVLGVLALLSRGRRPGAHIGSSLRTWLAQGGCIVAVALLVVNLGYECVGSFRQLKDFVFVSQTFSGAEATDALPGIGNRFRGTWLGELVVPVPGDYLLGIDLQRRDFEIGAPSYLAGQWRGAGEGGWWYYYLYALAVKLPLGFAGLFLWSIALTLRGHSSCAGRLEELLLGLPALVVLVLVSSQTGFSCHMRYVLPLFPFLIVATGKVAFFLQPGQWTRALAIATLLSWGIGSSLAVYPHSLSYFNDAAGGPDNGGAYLLDSNLDWGQDLLFLKRWVADHPEAQPLGLAYLDFRKFP